METVETQDWTNRELMLRTYQRMVATNGSGPKPPMIGRLPMTACPQRPLRSPLRAASPDSDRGHCARKEPPAYGE